MAYNTRRIKKDLDEKPIPQVYNPVADEYEPLQGSAAGGNRVQLYDGDGNPVGVATDAKLEAARVLLASLDDKDYATQAKQDDATAVLDAISTAVATAATEATLAQIKTALTDGTLKAQLSGSIIENRRLYPVKPLERELLDIPTYDGSGQVVHPSVVHIPEGFGGHTYWMAITPYPNSNNRYENPSIYCSDDGVTWAPPEGLANPLVPAPEAPAFNNDPCLLHYKGKLYLYWQVGGVTPQLMKRLESSDGVNWVNAQTCAFDDNWSRLSPAVTIEDGTLNMWRLVAENGSQLWLYTSNDGLDWQRQMSIVGISDGVRPWHNSILKDTCGYHFVTATFVRGMGSAVECDLRYGFGTDLYNVMYDNVPLLSRGEAGAWSATTLYHSSLVVDRGIPYLYVSAMHNSVWRLARIRCAANNRVDYPIAKTYSFSNYMDVTILAGANKVWSIQQDRRRTLQIAVRLAEARKYKLEITYHNPLNKESVYTETIENAEAAKAWTALEYTPKHPYYTLRLTNTDTSDLVLRSMFVTSE